MLTLGRVGGRGRTQTKQARHLKKAVAQPAEGVGRDGQSSPSSTKLPILHQLPSPSHAPEVVLSRVGQHQLAAGHTRLAVCLEGWR